jgi:thiamine-monophosphate kinase
LTAGLRAPVGPPGPELYGGKPLSGTIKGEAELIGTYLAPLARGYPGAFGLGDDCAMFTPAPGTELVITTDAVAGGVHFFPDDAPQDIGWKALAVNVSDLAAKGAVPRLYQMALSFPEAPTHDVMARLAQGLAEAQAAFGIVLSGGDTDRRPGPMTITITAIGEVPAGYRLNRAGGRAGDRLFVSGTLGDAALGLKVRRGDPDTQAWGLSEPERTALVGRYLRPVPRLDLRDALATWATAALDLSDGLAKDLGRLAAASGTGAEIEVGRLPLSAAVHKILTIDATAVESVLGGGDDYEVLFAVPPESAGDVVAWARTAGVAVTEIGALTESAGVILQATDGSRRTLAPAGWDHF